MQRKALRDRRDPSLETVKDSEYMIWTSRQERAACELTEKMSTLAINEDAVMLDMPVTKRKFSAVEMPQILGKRSGEPLESEKKRARNGPYTRPLARKIGSSAGMPFLQQTQQTAASSPLSLNDITQQILSLAIASAITTCPQAPAPTAPQNPALVQPATVDDADLAKIQNKFQGLEIDPPTTEQLTKPSSEPATSKKTDFTNTPSEPASEGPKSSPTTTELMNPDREPATTHEKTVVVDKSNDMAPKQQDLPSPSFLMPPPKMSATQMTTDRTLKEAEATFGGLSLQSNNSTDESAEQKPAQKKTTAGTVKSKNEARREEIVVQIDESIQDAEEPKKRTQPAALIKMKLKRVKSKLLLIDRYLLPGGKVSQAHTSRDWMEEEEISAKLFRVDRWMLAVRQKHASDPVLHPLVQQVIAALSAVKGPIDRFVSREKKPKTAAKEARRAKMEAIENRMKIARTEQGTGTD